MNYLTFLDLISLVMTMVIIMRAFIIDLNLSKNLVSLKSTLVEWASVLFCAVSSPVTWAYDRDLVFVVWEVVDSLIGYKTGLPEYVAIVEDYTIDGYV